MPSFVVKGNQINIKDRLRVTGNDVDVQNSKIINVTTPTLGTDGSNKDYVDTGLATKADLVHASRHLPSGADPLTTAAAIALNANSTNTTGTANSFARSDHTHDLATGVVSGQTPDQTSAEGTSTNLARADHVHNIPTATAVGLDATTANAQGAAATFARSNHTHAIATGAAATQTPDQTNATGTSANLARADHTHNIPTAAAVTLDATSTNTQGAATTFARSNHTHAITTGAASTQTPAQANAAGTSASLARADHVHNIPVATPVDTGTANAAGTAASFARADHVHDTTIVSDTIKAVGEVQTTSGSDVLLTGMTVTPAAGTYKVIGYTNSRNSTNGAINRFSLYAGGTQVTDTLQNIQVSNNRDHAWSAAAEVTVNGSQAIEIRWNRSAGTASTFGRYLTYIRVT